MAPKKAVSSPPRRLLRGVLIAVLTIGALVLTILALDHVRPRPTDDAVAPVPSFSQPAPQTPSPIPNEQGPVPASYDRSQERFLTVSADALWRGTAGLCGQTEPVLERSADGGQTWIDVTPRYLEIGQLVALNPFATGQAEIVALMTAGCEVQALRTFTQGQFWEPNDEALAAAQYADPSNTGSILRQAAAPLAAPCPDARSVRAAGAVLATVCDGTAYVLDQDAEWRALGVVNAAALNIDGDDVIVAHVSEQCDGVALTRFAAAGEGERQDAGCVEDAEPGAPTAVAFSGDDVLVWSGVTVAVIPR